MKSKLALIVLMMFGAMTANAVLIPIKTSCGKTVYLESSEYASMQEMAIDAKKISDAVCNKELERVDPEELIPSHP